MGRLTCGSLWCAEIVLDRQMASDIMRRVRQGPTPVFRICASVFPKDKAAMRPVFWVRDVAVFHQAVVDVIQVAPEIFLIMDDMVPVPFLPEPQRARQRRLPFVLMGEIRLQRVHNFGMCDLFLGEWMSK